MDDRIDNTEQDLQTTPQYAADVQSDSNIGGVPASTVWPPAPQGQAVAEAPFEPIIGFRAMNPFLLFFLILVTLGIYLFVWMYKQIKLLNAYSPKAAVPMPLFWISAALWLGILSPHFSSQINPRPLGFQASLDSLSISPY